MASNTYLHMSSPRKILHTRYSRSKSQPRADSRPQAKVWNIAVLQLSVRPCWDFCAAGNTMKRIVFVGAAQTRKDTRCTNKSRGGCGDPRPQDFPIPRNAPRITQCTPNSDRHQTTRRHQVACIPQTPLLSLCHATFFPSTADFEVCP